MPELHFPWLEVSFLIPAAGALWLALARPQGKQARVFAIFTAVLALICALGEWYDFSRLNSFEAHDHFGLLGFRYDTNLFVVDELSAPLIPLSALLFLLVILATLSDKIHRFSFALTLISEAIVLATLSCRASWVLVILMSVAVIPPWWEIRSRGRCTRVFTLHMGVFVGALLSGWGLLAIVGPDAGAATLFAGALLAGATLLRSGIAPVHCWMPDLFEKASFGTAILFVTPLTGAYAAMRLVLPIAPEWGLRSIAILSLVTAVYAAAMALIQTEARRYFCFVLLSNASLVLVGLELVTPIGMAGALCVWLSVMICLTGFGLTIRSIEARIGRISLTDYHGLYRQIPTLAGFFLLTGLSSIGFPATIGFVGLEMLVEGAVDVYPLVGMLVVAAAGLNGIGMLNNYFRIFGGRRGVARMLMPASLSEKVAVLVLSTLILGGGIFPQPGVHGRYHAALQLSEKGKKESDDVQDIPEQVSQHRSQQANSIAEKESE